MKNIHVIILGVLIVFLAILFGAATLKSTGKYRFRVSASDMLGRITRENHFITAAVIASQFGEGDEVIDVRDPRSFISNHLRNSINIPLERILDAENLELFKDGKSKILCCDDGRLSNSAWMILNQFGIRNLKVLDGGLNALNAFLVNKDNSKDKPQGDEAIRFDLKKMTGSDSSSVSSGTDGSSAKPVIKASVQKSKMKVKGGCN